MVAEFTKVLCDLMVEKDLDLQDSLKIMARLPNSRLKKCGFFLLNEIMNGGSLSNSMRRCPYLSFDDIYICFINFAERAGAGRLEETLTFLDKRMCRRKEMAFKLIEVGIYPSLVVLLAGGGSLFLHFSDIFQVGREIFIYLGLLLFVCFGIFMGLKSVLGENRLYEAFLAIGFLLKAGVSIYDSVVCGAQIMGITSKKGQQFLRAGEKLLLGMDLENAFALGKKYSNAFYFAEKSGGNADIFEKLAKWIGEVDERKRAICISLIEPLFIFVTGLFLIILVVNIFMPYISNLSFI